MGSMPHSLPRGSEIWLGALEGAEQHAIDRAQKRGITARMILEALVNPRYVRAGSKAGQTRYDGERCSVVLDQHGVMVTVFFKAENDPLA